MVGKLVLMLGMVITGAAAAVGLAHAPDDVASKSPDTPVLPLSEDHRAALIAEMLGVKAGVAELSGSIAMGQWTETAEQAGRIRDSYILKQKLTPAELEQLESALPADFIERDGQFHRHADGLARAAAERDYELEVFHFSRMMEACGACHVRYATHVLEGFRTKTEVEHAH